MSTTYSFEADWRPYAFPENESHLASEDEIREKYTTVQLKRGKALKAGGIPILSDGKTVTFNANNEMSIIFGATGSKKSRTLIAPLICISAQAGESMIIPDIKGELCQGALSPQIRGALRENGYHVIVLNFRDLNCDGYNILLEPYRLYRNGHRNEAMTEVNHIVDALASIYNGSSADPFWRQTATQYLMSVIILLCELCDDPAKINILSLATYTNEDSSDKMRQIVDLIECDNNIMTMLRSVVSEPEKTRMSTLATVNSFFSGFITNEKLLKMLSTSTFSIEELYQEKTALFLILPDETDTYRGIIGLLLSQISAFLVRAAYKFGGALPRRVHYICDEFAQYYIPNMANNISAHRSRGMRWTIVCQSRKQLETAYQRDAATILANCTNLYFLSSPETELLEELSLRAGYTNETPDGQPRRLISVASLRNLKKGWDYADVYFASGSTVCVSRLPDISKYQFVSRYKTPGKLETRVFPELSAYTAKQMLQDIEVCRQAYCAMKSGRQNLSVLERKAADRYQHMFQERNFDHNDCKNS